mmetsp:Transcript_48061/g.93882  ORF Transcript_48061/g.93882 Transcript_48061/m.93882 type:complete len:247 (-) Transcript_48061:2128-2868(-)
MEALASVCLVSHADASPSDRKRTPSTSVRRPSDAKIPMSICSFRLQSVCQLSSSPPTAAPSTGSPSCMYSPLSFRAPKSPRHTPCSSIAESAPLHSNIGKEPRSGGERTNTLIRLREESNLFTASTFQNSSVTPRSTTVRWNPGVARSLGRKLPFCIFLAMSGSRKIEGLPTAIVTPPALRESSRKPKREEAATSAPSSGDSAWYSYPWVPDALCRAGEMGSEARGVVRGLRLLFLGVSISCLRCC